MVVKIFKIIDLTELLETWKKKFPYASRKEMDDIEDAYQDIIECGLQIIKREKNDN